MANELPLWLINFSLAKHVFGPGRTLYNGVGLSTYLFLNEMAVELLMWQNLGNGGVWQQFETGRLMKLF